MRELWQEIMASIMRNKLRAVLTGFSVAWGIFMLAVLLGAGKGIENGIMATLSERTLNVISVWGGRTTLAYKGYQEDRRIRFDKSDLEFLGEKFDNIEKATGNYNQYTKASYGPRFLTVRLEGVTPEYVGVNHIEMISGRFPNQMDLAEGRKVAAVETDIAEVFFPRTDPIGKQITADGVNYTIIGVTKSRQWGGTLFVFVPLSSLESIYSAFKNDYRRITFLANDLKTKQQNEDFNEVLGQALRARHSVAPSDPGGVNVGNSYLEYIETKKVLDAITWFIWGIGIFTLLAGIVGVSNIMLVTVRERMNEIGVRKALGATPFQILVMILAEALVITLFFGYVGLLLGMGVMEFASSYLAAQSAEDGFGSMIFKNPTIDMGVAISATVLLVVAGLAAGFIPAYKAVRMKTIDTLRQQK